MFIKCLNLKFVAFSLSASLHVDKNNNESSIKILSDADLSNNWKVYLFFPKAFSPVCSSEIVSFDNKYNEFKSLNTEIVGISIDSDYALEAWRRSNPKFNVQFPLLSDIKRNMITELGTIGDIGVSERVVFIVDDNNLIRFVSVYPLSVVPNSDEVLRVLKELVEPTINNLCSVK